MTANPGRDLYPNGGGVNMYQVWGGKCIKKSGI